jgi:hypothetical protein
MALTVTDLQDLIRLLDEHPDWKLALRQRLIDDDLARLPALAVEIADLVRASESRLARLEELVQQNTAILQQNGERLDAIDKRLVMLETRMDRNEARLRHMDGRLLEMDYRNKAYAYFGRRLRKVRVLSLDDVPGLLDAYDSGRITHEQWRQLARLDAIISGVPHGAPADQQVLIALEASVTIDDHDIDRAAAGATVLTNLGYAAIGAVGAESIREADSLLAASRGVAVLIGGDVSDWPESACMPQLGFRS